jgi:hypothetical protein
MRRRNNTICDAVNAISHYFSYDTLHLTCFSVELKLQSCVPHPIEGISSVRSHLSSIKWLLDLWRVHRHVGSLSLHYYYTQGQRKAEYIFAITFPCALRQHRTLKFLAAQLLPPIRKIKQSKRVCSNLFCSSDNLKILQKKYVQR